MKNLDLDGKIITFFWHRKLSSFSHSATVCCRYYLSYQFNIWCVFLLKYTSSSYSTSSDGSSVVEDEKEIRIIKKKSLIKDQNSEFTTPRSGSRRHTIDAFFFILNFLTISLADEATETEIQIHSLETVFMLIILRGFRFSQAAYDDEISDS